MGKYDVKYDRLAVMLLPVCLRGERMCAMARVVTSAVAALHADFSKYRADVAYRLAHNGQTCYLRAALNDRFDPTGRGVTITENPSNDDNGIQLHWRETGRFHILHQRETGNASVLYRRGYNGVLRYGFWINVPGRLQGTCTLEEVRAVTNIYKLASIRFKVSFV